MKELIRHILKEETSLQRKLLNKVEEFGFVKASTFVGGVRNLVKILGEDLLTEEMMINFFKDFFDDYYEDEYILDKPYFTNQEDGVLASIISMNEDGVVINVSGDIYDEYDVIHYDYEDIPGETIEDLFIILIDSINNERV